MTQRTEIVHVLVRSNPNKKDSFHYGKEGKAEAERLQKFLGTRRQRVTGQTIEAEHTSILTLEIDRDTCAVAIVRT